MVELFANGARGPLSVQLLPGGTTLLLGAGSEVLFPTPGAGDFYWLTLEHGPASDPIGREIVRCDARAGNALTIVRAQQGTVALTFPASSTRVELRLTAATLESFRDALGFGRKLLIAGYAPEGPASYSFGPFFNSVETTPAPRVTPTTTKWGLIQPRITYSSTANAQRIGNTTNPERTAIGLRGTAPRIGGFEFLIRFVIDTDVANTRKLIGVSDSAVSDRLAAGSPSSLINDAMVGVGQETGTPIGTSGGTWQLYHCDGLGVSVTQVNTLVQKVIGNLMQLRIISPVGVPRFYVELIDFDAGVRYFTELSTNIPDGDDMMLATLVSRATGTTDGISVVGMWAFTW